MTETYPQPCHKIGSAWIISTDPKQIDVKYVIDVDVDTFCFSSDFEHVLQFKTKEDAEYYLELFVNSTEHELEISKVQFHHVMFFDDED